MLQDLAVQMDFEVTYVDIEEKTLDDKHQCLVQLSSMPVAVCHGTGENIRDAQVNAALNALEYLKVMTKKWNVTEEQPIFRTLNCRVWL